MDHFGKRNNNNRQEDSGAVWTRIRIYLLKKGLLQEESAITGLFWEKRIWHKTNAKSYKYSVSTRAYFIAKVFEIVTEEDFMSQSFEHDIYKLVTIGEYCITIMYLENHFIDGKYGVTDIPSRKRNREEKEEIESRLYNFIEKEFEPATRQKINKHLKKLFDVYSEGNKLDLNDLRIDSYDSLSGDSNNTEKEKRLHKIIDVSEIQKLMQGKWDRKYAANKHGEIQNPQFLKRYLQRSFMINGIFFRVFTNLICDFYTAPLKIQMEMSRFSERYGIVQQLVNDNIDVLPRFLSVRTSAKLDSDAFSDLRRGMITLPTFCHLQNSNLDRENDAISRFLHEEKERNSLIDPYVQFESLLNLKNHLSINKAMALTAEISVDYLKNADWTFLGNQDSIRNMTLLRDLLHVSCSNAGYYKIKNAKNIP